MSNEVIKRINEYATPSAYIADLPNRSMGQLMQDTLDIQALARQFQQMVDAIEAEVLRRGK